MLGLEVPRERVPEDAGEDELDEHVDGCDEERVGECEAVGGEHPFVVDREQRCKEEPVVKLVGKLVGVYTIIDTRAASSQQGARSIS